MSSLLVITFSACLIGINIIRNYSSVNYVDSPLAVGGNPFVAKSDISLIKGIPLAREAKK